MKDGWQFLSTLLTIGFNFFLCNFHLFRKLLNISIKCPRVHSLAFCSTGCMFYKSIVKKHILVLFGLVVPKCFFFSVLLFSLALLFSKCLWIYGLFSQFPLAKTPTHASVFYRTLPFVLFWYHCPPVTSFSLFCPACK